MRNLQNGKGQPVVTHLMPTDLCNHTCAFCSVQTRAGETLPLADMFEYLEILMAFGLKAVIISGGGNPILYRHGGYTFDHLVDGIHGRGLEIGLITNGMPLETVAGRRTWKGVHPHTLDKCTWIRISMSGFDHREDQVFVPDLDSSRTTLGFSYILHDIYQEPLDKNHGKVSTLTDLHTAENLEGRVTRGDDRLPKLTRQIREIVEVHHPAYVRLLPNCLEPSRIPERCATLQKMADEIDPSTVFVQYKPPSAPRACYLGYIHPVLNSDGYVYPCDSCVLNETAGHKFANPWRVCHWSEIARIYEEPVRSLIKDPKVQCPGCVFPQSNEILAGVVDGAVIPASPNYPVQHVNFV